MLENSVVSDLCGAEIAQVLLSRIKESNCLEFVSAGTLWELSCMLEKEIESRGPDKPAV